MDIDDDFDELSAGRAVLRDPETGKFKKAYLSPEQARAMVAAKVEATPKKLDKEARAEADAKALLIEKGYDPETAPASVRISARLAAEEGPNAMRLWLNQTGELKTARRDSASSYDGVGPCPLCGRATHEFNISEEAAAQIGAAISGRLDHEETDI